MLMVNINLTRSCPLAIVSAVDVSLFLFIKRA